MASEKILLVTDSDTGSMLAQGILAPAGYLLTQVTRLADLETVLASYLPDLVFLSETVEGQTTQEIAARLQEMQPGLPLVLLARAPSGSQVLEALRAGFSDYLAAPYRPNDVLSAVQRGLKQRRRWQTWAAAQTRQDTRSLQQRLMGLEALQEIGRKVTGLLNLDQLLTAVVDAAVKLANAEEGSLLLLDEASGELYVRAERNFQENFAHAFRLPISDSLAGQVLRSGQPVLLDENTPQKIKTAYLVYTLIYVPLSVKGKVIGVLAVDNRQNRQSFGEHQVAILSALADYAAIAIENARLYERSEAERAKLETILTQIEEGVIVLDAQERILLINPTAQQAFNLKDENLTGKLLEEVIHHEELVERLHQPGSLSQRPFEILLEDGRSMNTQMTRIPEVGLAVTLQDITHLKELDRIKSDFVNTVSHDLRSPLTAILGYVELIGRVAPVTPQQAEFINRVQVNVNSITALINDLLDLGRIEAGFDTRQEAVSFPALIEFTLDGLRPRLEDKNQQVQLEIAPALPLVQGNPVQLRQVVSNLLGNAVKYTPSGGQITIRVEQNGEQVIFQVEDNGPGIPLTEQPYIFDKFFRASNTANQTQGTGLGLSIVKSVVESHLGRIWVNSALGRGSTFTVVLPAVRAV